MTRQFTVIDPINVKCEIHTKHPKFNYRGSKGKRLNDVNVTLKEMKKMLKTASKNIIPSPSNDLLKIAIWL